MNVLLAEDSLTMRRLLASQLQGWNYGVTEANDGAEAWELFQNSHFSLVLTDWVMPGMDGLELIRRIRESKHKEYVYILLLTTRSANENLVEAMEAGADDFLAKPCNPKELRVRLRAGERIIELERTLIRQNTRLKQAQAALVQSEKLAGLGQLAAGMAHEINNPISYVFNNLSVLQRDTQAVMKLLERLEPCLPLLRQADPEQGQQLTAAMTACDVPWLQENLPKLFESMQDGLARVRRIVSNLRDFAHLDEALWDNMDVVGALESTVSILAAELESRQLTVDLQADDRPMIHCQPAKIKQVFHGILMNAIQASAAHDLVKIRVSQVKSFVTVEFTDEGAGMDKVTQQRLFEPFYTTHPVGAGQGLGLAISYGIVKQHSGTIDFTTKPGEGSTFRVKLPITAWAPAKSRTATV
ncbi:MAG: response regulator [Planctomycetaceae bacterium]